jgi:hypothetical protein
MYQHVLHRLAERPLLARLVNIRAAQYYQTRSLQGTTPGTANFPREPANTPPCLGLYQVIYESKGYWFRTPEAWDDSGNFRASMYMHPAAVWATEMAGPAAQ